MTADGAPQDHIMKGDDKTAPLLCLYKEEAVWITLTTEKLVAILVMLCALTTVSSFVMARNMGHNGQFSSGVIMMTTLCSAVTLTGELYILKTVGLV